MDLKAEVRAIIANVVRLDDAVVLDPSFESRPLPIDSMLAIEIMAVLEKRFGITIPEDQLYKFDRFDTILEVVEARLHERDAAAETAASARA